MKSVVWACQDEEVLQQAFKNILHLETLNKENDAAVYSSLQVG